MTRVLGRIPIMSDDIPTLQRLRRLCDLLADDSATLALDRDVIDEILVRVSHAEPDYGHQHAREWMTPSDPRLRIVP